MDPGYVIGALALGVLLHVLLLMLSQRWNGFAILTACFLVVAPLSLANLLPGLIAFKLARVYLTMLTVFAGVLIVRRLHPGPACLAMGSFIGMYVLAGIWSDYPIRAAYERIPLIFAFSAGVLFSLSLQHSWDLTRSLRILALAVALNAALYFAYLAVDPSGLIRLSPWGMNANTLGLTAAQMFLIALAVGIYDPVRRWRTFGFVLSSLSAVLLLASGSRGATGSAMIGLVILMLPLVRRPGRFITWTVLGGAVLLIAMTQFQTAVDRFQDIDFHNREGVWNKAMGYVQDSPIFGQGWVYAFTADGSMSPTNLHSAYLNILAETGLLGAVYFTIAVAATCVVGLKVRAQATRLGTHVGAVHFALAVFLALLGHAAIETAVLLGTTVQTIMLGLSVGLSDQVRLWLRQDGALISQVHFSSTPSVNAGAWGAA